MARGSRSRDCACRAVRANPSLHGRVTGVVSAVGDTTHDPEDSRSLDRTGEIQAGFRPDDGIRFVRLDDFVAEHGLDRVDVIKMDVKGAEPAVLCGASAVLRRFLPRLAVSVYHDREHFIELPRILREIEPAYQFAFAQLSPVARQAALYAWCDGSERAKAAAIRDHVGPSS